MRNLATALAISILYLDGRNNTFTEDDDVQALENIAAELQSASIEEKHAVISALVCLERNDLVAGLGLT